MSKEIKAVLPSKAKAKAADALNIAHAVDAKLFGNGDFKTPVLTQQQFEADMNTLATANIGALDGSKTAIAARNKALEVLLKDLRLLATYVSATCNDDMETFLGSGFQAAPSRIRTTPQTAAPPDVSVDQGPTGVLIAWVSLVALVKSYEIRKSQEPVPGSAPVWTSVGIPNTRVPATFTGLTPGVVYTFQARALGRLGYSDWGMAVSRMCI